MKRWFCFLLVISFIFAILPPNILAQNIPEFRTKVRAYRQANEHKIVNELTALLAIPNLASDSANIRRNAVKLVEMLEQRGIRTQRLEVPGSPPVVFGELQVPGAKRTLMFYAHYDGQPVAALKWDTEPWQPVLRDQATEAGGKIIPMPSPDKAFEGEWRIYARSASDDKSPIVAMLTALDALKANQIKLTTNLKFFFEGEEEAGSPHLEAIVAKYARLLKADAWILCDGPVHQTRRQQLYFGVRGIVSFEMTVYGANRELHSGHYGNWAPNPAMRLSQLLASMKNESGRVLVPGFYDGVEPLNAVEQKAIADAPDSDADLMRSLGFSRAEGGGKKLIELINLPSLNIRGLQSATVGDNARNVVPASATAAIDIRLVKGTDKNRMRELVENHIRQQGYHIVHADPDHETRLKYPKLVKTAWEEGYNASRTSMDLPISQSIIAAVEAMKGEPVIKMPTLGGSVPFYIFTDMLQTPAIGVPIVNHDNNQHSANENLRLQNLWDGIEVLAALMTMR
ncbi:MAG: M20/M25/M40 family metallo-hydrolase [candidate division KSB1 bacterium]|nr:M20/M25/M40 family metallo-hydrolase [candidate division KSB1 bacterium]MDZ7364720.1 M20/M25/M40 family metallo-hydrolase [candidate division KSB1 bacterium]MDZ7402532.1 M20/M25/M40 family metallo-hydrolase [candidate division KSB1 bacterium]